MLILYRCRNQPGIFETKYATDVVAKWNTRKRLVEKHGRYEVSDNLTAAGARELTAEDLKGETVFKTVKNNALKEKAQQGIQLLVEKYFK